MLVSMETYLRAVRGKLRRWAANPRLLAGGQAAAWAGGGFLLSAASLGNSPQPLAMGLICAQTGWRALVMALGSILGYRVFWGSGGVQPMVWSAAGALLALFLGKRTDVENQPLLFPLLAAVLVAVIGLSFQVLAPQNVSIAGFFLRISLAAGAALLFQRAVHRRDTVPRWLAGGAVVLALAQVSPVPYGNLGCMAAGVMAVSCSFPAAALGGLGLDLSGITRLPMTAVVCMAYLLRQLPFEKRYLRYAAPGAACMGVMVLLGSRDFGPLPGLLLGGYIGMLLPPRPQAVHRLGETGIAQVRLELAAGVLAEMGHLLAEAEVPPIDQEALVDGVKARVCGSCVHRSGCREQSRLEVRHLHRPLDFHCRKAGRVIGELQRSQEQLRLLQAQRLRQGESRGAVVQQYRFLSNYLKNIADQLPRRGQRLRASYALEVGCRSAGGQRVSGDVCLSFPGTGCRYYLLLCDGMGTGMEARQEAAAAGRMVQRLLTAGFPAEYAFRSVNSLLALRGQAGAATLDLAEVRLDTGKAALYKWGAAPSWVLRRKGAERLGTATAPPGIFGPGGRETVLRLTLRQGETLILTSDGIDPEPLLRSQALNPDAPPGDIAAALATSAKTGDDATAAVLRLRPTDPVQ